MDTIIFAVGVLVMMMVVGGCFLSMMVSFTADAQAGIKSPEAQGRNNDH